MRRHLLLACAVLGFALGAVRAADFIVIDDPKEKRFAFSMTNKPWKEVLEWLTEQTGLPLLSSHKPPVGTFTFIGPKDGKRQYSLAEIMDLLNEALMQEKRLLIRQEKSML